jgi:outer membrane immunogenic protein
MTSSGFAGGGEGGCNYQVNDWFVIGAEGDFQYTGLNATNTGAIPRLRVGNSFTETFSSDWLTTVRGRAGIASGQWLFFATGGLAQANVSFSDFVFFPFSSTTNAASNSGMRGGWTAGGGAEWAFAPRWSVKAEYLYVDLGTASFTSTNSNPAKFPRASIVHSHSLTENISRFGLNYAF